MKNIAANISLLLLFLTSNQIHANGHADEHGHVHSEGDGYITISPPQPTQSGEKIEVVEVFWYACPHCFDFEPHISTWLESKPDDVQFIRMPAIFRKNWIPHAKAYFTADKLGVLDSIHTPLFDALHKRKKNIHDDDAIKKFFVKNGVDKSEFTKIYESDEVQAKVKRAFVMGQRYKLTGVPAVIINGKYMVSGSTAGSFENVLKIINQLIDEERGNKTNE